MQINAFASQIATYIIIAIAAFLLAWGVLGMAEYVTQAALVIPLQNPAFPPGIQFLQWVLLIAFGTVFLVGYAARWRHTPFAVSVIFAMLATMCFVQTFDFLTNDSRYIGLVLECIAYLAIATFLFRSERMRLRFS